MSVCLNSFVCYSPFEERAPILLHLTTASSSGLHNRQIISFISFCRNCCLKIPNLMSPQPPSNPPPPHRKWSLSKRLWILIRVEAWESECGCLTPCDGYVIQPQSPDTVEVSRRFTARDRNTYLNIEINQGREFVRQLEIRGWNWICITVGSTAAANLSRR